MGDSQVGRHYASVMASTDAFGSFHMGITAVESAAEQYGITRCHLHIILAGNLKNSCSH